MTSLTYLSLRSRPRGDGDEARSVRISRPAHQLELPLFCMRREIFLTQNSRETALGGPDASIPRRVMNCARPSPRASAVGSGIVADSEKSLVDSVAVGRRYKASGTWGGNAISRTCPRSTSRPREKHSIQCGNPRRLFLFTVSTWWVCCTFIINAGTVRIVF